MCMDVLDVSMCTAWHDYRGQKRVSDVELELIKIPCNIPCCVESRKCLLQEQIALNHSTMLYIKLGILKCERLTL